MVLGGTELSFGEIVVFGAGKHGRGGGKTM